MRGAKQNSDEDTVYKSRDVPRSGIFGQTRKRLPRDVRAWNPNTFRTYSVSGNGDARVGRQATAAGVPLAATGYFAGGYFLTWIGFSVVATIAQWALERAALLDAGMASASNVLGGVVLIAAGVYQWTPLKDVCLTQCQTPLLFLMRHGGFRQEASACLLLGLRHGAYCIGCCWVLMALLFVGGVMNVLWIALLALLVLLEKLFLFGRWIARAAGLAFLVAGTWLLFLEMA